MAPKKDQVVWVSFLVLCSFLSQVDFANGATPQGDQSKGSAGSKSSFVTSQEVNSSHFPRIPNWVSPNLAFLFFVAAVAVSAVSAAVSVGSFLLGFGRQRSDQKVDTPSPPVPPAPPAPQPTPDDGLSGDGSGDGTGSLDDIITLEDVIDIDDSGSNDGYDRGSNNGV